MPSTVQAEDIRGTWVLRSYVASPAAGGAPYFPLGPDAIGLIHYSRTGHMSAQLMRPGRTSSAKHWDDFSPADAQVAASGYIAYSGTYSIRGDLITHHVQTSLFPNWVGTDLHRIATIDDGQLELRITEPVHLHGALRHPVLTWLRPSAI